MLAYIDSVQTDTVREPDLYSGEFVGVIVIHLIEVIPHPVCGIFLLLFFLFFFLLFLLNK